MKYFGGEEHEGERYRKSINKYQALEYQVISMCIRPLNVALANHL